MAIAAGREEERRASREESPGSGADGRASGRAAAKRLERRSAPFVASAAESPQRAQIARAGAAVAARLDPLDRPPTCHPARAPRPGRAAPRDAARARAAAFATDPMQPCIRRRALGPFPGRRR